MTVETFAREHRLKVQRDACGDPVIYGTSHQGEYQLYFDAGELCLMVLDGRVVKRGRWEALGGKLWLGDISADREGRRAQDVKVTGIPLAHAGAAIRMARVKRKRLLSEAQSAAFQQAGAATRFKPHA
jgi:hypothetical protein